MNAMFEKLVSKLKRGGHVEALIDMPDKIISTAAFPGVEEPERIHKDKRRIKENYTNYWDMDYLSSQDVDKLYYKDEE